MLIPLPLLDINLLGVAGKSLLERHCRKGQAEKGKIRWRWYESTIMPSKMDKIPFSAVCRNRNRRKAFKVPRVRVYTLTLGTLKALRRFLFLQTAEKGILSIFEGIIVLSYHLHLILPFSACPFRQCLSNRLFPATPNKFISKRGRGINMRRHIAI